jgi:hypothetical protein
MELAHRHTGLFRIIGKIILLGILVVVFAKAILALLALAFVGLLAFVCARALYLRRANLRRILLGLEEAIWSAKALFRFLASVLLATAGRLLLCACRLAGLACALAGSATQTGSILVRSGISWAQLPIRGCRSVGHAVKFVAVGIRNRAEVICGAVVEIASGALVGALLLNLPNIGGSLFLPDPMFNMGPRVCVGAVFGAFLGLVLSISRISIKKT